MKVIVKETGEIIEAEYEGQNGIDWEERRYELAKAAMQGLLANNSYTKINIYSLAEDSCNCADAVIQRLKGGK